MGPDFVARSDQIDASLRETRAILGRLHNGPSLADIIGDLRDQIAALAERVAKLEGEE